MMGIKCFYTNSDQLLNKIEDLKMLIADDEPDVMMITEVIPKAQKHPISDTQLNIEGYKVYKNFQNVDLNLGASGMRGVAIYVKNNLRSNEVTPEIAQHNDQLWIEIELLGRDKLLCGCMYRSPSNNKEKSRENAGLISHSITKAMERKSSHVLISGDFNFKEIDWENEFVEGNSAKEMEDKTKGVNQHVLNFMETLQSLFLKQHVTEPTRYRSGEEPSLLDLIITNEAGMIENLAHYPALGDSDHCCLKFNLNCYAAIDKRKLEEMPNYYRADYITIKSHLSIIDWDAMLNGTMHEDYPKFIEQLNSATRGCIPKRISPRKKKNLYMTTEAMRLKNKKNHLWRRYIHTKTPYDLSVYTRCKNRIRNLTKSLRRQYEGSIVKQIKGKPKIFWKYVKSKLKTRERIPTLKNTDGTLSVSPYEKAEALNHYFSSVFIEENLTDIPDIPDIFISDPLDSFVFTEEIILKKLQQLNPSKSPGLDGWHPYLLRELAKELSKPLSILFQKSLIERVVPIDWLKACITAIHKKGAKDTLNNYRPVSLTSVLCKIFESIIKEIIINHLIKNKLLAEEQHGFVPHRNCMTNLLTAIEDWSTMMDQGKSFDVIYTDFSKAFDSVPHTRLNRKLKSIGISGDILGWIEAFLANRRQKVTVEGVTSSWTDVKSGIPQGSVLGPILFVVFINDMPNNLLSNCKMFADDAKVYRDVNNIEGHESLQSDLYKMCQWSQRWQLPFNEHKCKCMHLGKHNPKMTYMMKNHILETTSAEKDLGVIVDDSLKFHKHTAAAVRKANTILGIIKKSFVTLNHQTLPLLYKSMVRPHLEYGNVIWGPHFKGDQQMIEKIQKRATKLIPTIRHLPYDQRLKSLKLPSLMHRRRRGDMLEAYKIVTNKVNVNKNHFFDFSNAPTRGHQYKIRKPKTTKLVRSQTFSQRVINDWNSLPQEVVDARTIHEFKAKIDNHWKEEQYITPFD